MPRRMALYVAGVVTAALALWLLMSLIEIGGAQPVNPVLLLLLLLSVLALQFPIEVGPNWKRHVANSLLLAGAFLLSPPHALALAFAATLLGNITLRLPILPRPVQRRPWWNWLFNAAQAALSLGSASAIYHLCAGNAPTFNPNSLGAAIGVVLAAVTAHLVSSGLVTGAVIIYRGGNPLTLWWERQAEGWREELGLAMLAIVTALVAEDYPWALLVQAGSIAIIYLSFKQSQQVRRQTRETIEHLAALVDHRDPYTFQHSQNVSRYAVRLAERLGLPGSEVELIRSAALIHDIGKIAVPDSILLKPGRLDECEWREMRRHPVVGADMVAHLPEYRAGARLIRHHHEAWDGRGYPDGLAGEAIPLGARIIALADSYDAMSTARPYRQALPLESIVEQLRAGKGRQWDPRLVELWLEEVGSGSLGAGREPLPLTPRLIAQRPA